MYRAVIMYLAILMAVAASAQTAASPQPSAQPNVAQAASASAKVDPAKQMQLDLDQMESLLNNMAAQVSFVHDTNMSILLNTNVQLWSVLIRDLRMQMEAQQQRQGPSKK